MPITISDYSNQQWQGINIITINNSWAQAAITVRLSVILAVTQ